MRSRRRWRPGPLQSGFGVQALRGLPPVLVRWGANPPPSAKGLVFVLGGACRVHLRSAPSIGVCLSQRNKGTPPAHQALAKFSFAPLLSLFRCAVSSSSAVQCNNFLSSSVQCGIAENVLSLITCLTYNVQYFAAQQLAAGQLLGCVHLRCSSLRPHAS